MITYLITSALLSAIGWVAYMLLVRRQAAPLHQKGFIYFVIISSLLLPVLGHQAQTPAVVSRFIAPPLPESVIQEGYEAQLRHFCQCENPNFSHRVHYRSNTFINFLFDHKSWLNAAILLGLVIVMIRILGQYLYLLSLRRKSRKENLSLNGSSYTVLHPPQPHAMGAFQLDRPYLIWQKEMDQLSKEELHAVIQHELSHLRQFNTLEKALLSFIQVIWLFNPVFYYFRDRLELISEWIADEAGSKAIGNRKTYAALLIRLKERQTVAAASHFKGQGSLQRRIQHLLSDRRRTPFLPLFALCLAVGIQFASEPYLSAQVDETLYNLETYEEIYLEHPQEEELLYCPDCHSVCLPVIEFNEEAGRK